MSNYNTRIENNEANTQQFAPYISALAYLESLYFFKSQDKYIKLIKEFDSNIVEKNFIQQKREGVLDFDQMMMNVLKLFRDNVQNIFHLQQMHLMQAIQLEMVCVIQKSGQILKIRENADLVCDREEYLSFDYVQNQIYLVIIHKIIFQMFKYVYYTSMQQMVNKQSRNLDYQERIGLLNIQVKWRKQINLKRMNQKKTNGLIYQLYKMIINPEQKKPILIAWSIYLQETELYFLINNMKKSRNDYILIIKI